MTYHDEDIEEHRLMRNAILDEVTDAAGESTKIPRLQRALQEFDENFDVIGLSNFNWGHTVNKTRIFGGLMNISLPPKSVSQSPKRRA